jgi:uncharacterized glyoxalase superfamily protein PhnB
MPESFKPEGRPTVVPRIITRHVAELANFIIMVLGASGEVQTGRPTELRIGESIVMVSDGDGTRQPMPAFLYVYVADADAAYERALARGAQPIEPPELMRWGDRRATFRDAWGNVWQVATHAVPRDA